MAAAAAAADAEADAELSPGFSSDEDDSGGAASASAAAPAGVSPAQKQRVEMQRRWAIALRAKRQQERADAAAAAASASAAPSSAGAAAAAGALSGKRRRTDASSGSSWRKDTHAGFFLPEEEAGSDGDGGAGSRRRRAAGIAPRELAPEVDNPFYPAHPKCKDCGSEFWNSQLQVQFGVMVCDECQRKLKDGKYALVTKTAAKEDYLLRESDLGGQANSLRFVEKPNRRNEKWSRVKLYLLDQVERRAFELYGGEEGLDKEFDKREAAKKERAANKQAKAMKKLRKDTLTARWMREPAKHEHEWGDEAHDEESDTWSRTCATCGHVDTYEKM